MRWFFIVLLTAASVMSLSAQESFTGLVVDSATFAALPFVTIQVKNKNQGTTTDISGSFRITASRNDTLIFSSIGYNTSTISLSDWEPAMVLLSEKVTLLDDVTILDTQDYNPYKGMFDEQNEALRKANKRLPFYYSRTKKQNIKVGRLANENIRVLTYVNTIIKNESLKETLIKKYKLSNDEYYHLLGDFNAKHYAVMYYLSAPELLSLINNYFATHAPLR